jgi:hypothetical protein
MKFCIVIKGKTIVWTLKNCLHAPDVPINLILVGALQEHNMSVIFSFQKTTIAFPSSHPQLGSLSFDAEVIHQPSLLQLDYISANVTLLAIVFTLFQVVSNSFELWHCRFGHLGQEATQDMLTRNYTTGITYKQETQTLLMRLQMSERCAVHYNNIYITRTECDWDVAALEDNC